MKEDILFNGKKSVKYCDSVWINEIQFELKEDDLFITFITNGKRLYIRKDKDGEFVIDSANEFKPLCCRNFRYKKIKDILSNIKINFGPHLKSGMIEIKRYLKENK